MPRDAASTALPQAKDAASPRALPFSFPNEVQLPLAGPLPLKKRCLAAPVVDRHTLNRALGQDSHPRFLLPPLAVQDHLPVQPLRLFSAPLPPTLSTAPHQCQRQ